jgi:hypothetical protein
VKATDQIQKRSILRFKEHYPVEKCRCHGINLLRGFAQAKETVSVFSY